MTAVDFMSAASCLLFCRAYCLEQNCAPCAVAVALTGENILFFAASALLCKTKTSRCV